MAVTGTAGNDFIHVATDGLSAPGPGYTTNSNATNNADTITSGGGGDDIIHAGGGDDTIIFGADLDGNDQIDGGDGANDTLEIDDQVGVTFGAASLTGIERIKIDAVPVQLGFLGFVGLTLNDANIAAHANMKIDAGALQNNTITHTTTEFSLDFSHETDAGVITVIGGHGPNTIVGRNQYMPDSVDVSNSSSADVTAIENVFVGANFNAADRFQHDTFVQIEGNYASGIQLNGTVFTGIQTVVIGPGPSRVDPGYNYHVTTTDDLVPQYGGIQIDASYVLAANSVTIDASAETNGFIEMYGGAGNDTLIGSSGGATYFDIYRGGDDHVIGGAPNDIITAFGAYTPADIINGGGGQNTLKLDGDYSSGVLLTGASLQNIQIIALGAVYQPNQGYTLIDDGTLLSAGQTITIDASHIDAAHTLSFDGHLETLGTFTVIAGNGVDAMVGGLGADSFDFTAANLTGADNVKGGGGAALDKIVFTTAGTIAATAFGQVTHVEALLLANGTNNIALPDALVGSADDGHIFYVYGGSGNDTINATAVTTATNRLAITSGSGNDVLAGGLGADTFYFAAPDLTAADIVNGNRGAGLDRIVFTTAGTVAAAAFAQVTHVEQLVLANGTNSITVADPMVSASDNSHILTITGGTGDDTIDASALTSNDRAYITSGAGNDTLRGGAGLDIFYFAAADKTSADYVDGGTGAPVDVLALTTPGTVLQTSFQQVYHIEELGLADGTNNIGLNDTMVGAADDNHLLYVIGGSGNDTIDGSAVTTAANRIDFVSHAGNDTLTGGLGADTFFFAATELTAADTVNGGTGAAVDSIVFNTAGTIAAGVFAGVSHIEQITLFNGTNSLALTDALVGSADDGHVLHVTGGNGADTIDASAVTTAANRVVFIGGGGADNLTAGAGGDFFSYLAASDSTGTVYDTITGLNFAADRIDIPGGAGVITLVEAARNNILNSSNFTGDLTTAFAGLGAHHAGLITAGGGTLLGQTFLVVDLDGITGYHAGTDLVLHLMSPTGTLTTGDFV